MIGQLLGVLAGILALIGASAFSYTYLEQMMGSRETAQGQEAPTVVAKKETIKTTEKTTSPTQAVPRKTVSKTPVLTTSVPAKTNGSLVPKTVAVEKTIVTPGPLRVVVRSPTTLSLSARGVIEYTNIARAQNGGLPPLIENSVLSRDAQMKVDDMLTKQYFEHVSPSGVGPADLAQAVGYAYVVVGENLALGDFSGDEGVVTAWMNSPGHRANILNTHYKEIGVAVRKGMYEGRETWLAVQSFGMPLSACPAIDLAIKAQIEAGNAQIASLRATLDAKKAQIDMTSTDDPNYNVYVNEFNMILPEYNNLVESNRAAVANYNAGVQAFNTCISAASGH